MISYVSMINYFFNNKVIKKILFNNEVWLKNHLFFIISYVKKFNFKIEIICKKEKIEKDEKKTFQSSFRVKHNFLNKLFL
jgi:hypothetical protein